MLLRTHLVFSIAIFFVLIHFLNIPNPLFFLLFILLATFIVDIDSYKSKAGNHWYLRPFQWLISHRGMIHSLFFALIISLLIAGLNNWAGFGFFVGYLSHLFLDLLTKSGISLFWPLSGKKFGLFIKSGGIVEEVLFVFLLVGDLFLVFWMFLD